MIIRRNDGSGQFVLLTNGPELGVAGKVMAFAYLERWGVQENSFKYAAAAVKLSQHRGNCGRIVSNVAVVTELEKLEGRIVTNEEKLGELTAAHDVSEHAAEQARNEHTEAIFELSRGRELVDELRETEGVAADQLAEAAVAYHEAVKRAEATGPVRAQAEQKLENNRRGRQEHLATIEQLMSQLDTLEPRVEIRQLDVALDSVLTSFKLVAFLLISFVLREYLSIRKMTAETFVSRVLPYRGRREVRPAEEVVVFYENPRDPEMNDALSHACDDLNGREISRSGRRLRYRMEQPQEKSRPPPVQLK